MDRYVPIICISFHAIQAIVLVQPSMSRSIYNFSVDLQEMCIENIDYGQAIKIS